MNLRVRLVPYAVAACVFGCGAALRFPCEGVDGTDGIVRAIGTLGGWAILFSWLPGITAAWVVRGALGVHAVPWLSWPIAALVNIALWGTATDLGTPERRRALVVIGIVTGPWLLMSLFGGSLGSPFRNP